jgi:hypothetical protein
VRSRSEAIKDNPTDQKDSLLLGDLFLGLLELLLFAR